MAKNNNQNQNQSMTTEEAGRKGGEKTSRKYDQEHFENIGQKGGETTSKEYSKEHFEEIGQKGGRNSGNGYTTTSTNNTSNQQFKTGEKAPESGNYKVDKLVNGNKSDNNKEISLSEGDQFPPSPSENEAAYWVKSS
ncbi:general stress protein [Halobacillus halophilus DSM 2266]|uniref:General stress protein n=1 Tax=Halobacillus halophilus (strain ATCC 35676 / DSM 2266 / JCM 20832 / KCTC 3685 / LMG 17431 / NBRC 102448 / NCIMB 2269) TaxID=866895 RepID=I0JKT7_HALH3|nr:YjzC family protein [Halobacillus halophilus]CCG44757.1 general stress protein [Halobacillus halophilus DSM 2266]